ncbi:hypothetical protein TEQG_06824 [Trichophyton equinum CBS 127.97]|uniref:Maintenance of telomere capping protein 1 n=1 Tax=Trichophyton equinum (strain ATCC MYA-4606 / CBS 127.97) TaxID=559882 RepID=F2Q0X4_TRIEC|nr:hypothetical protein TEQG_06824 [Trichophyton equinum CBS 127.97]
MTTKDGKHTPTTDELLAQFDDLSVDAVSAKPPQPGKQGAVEDDVLDEFQNLVSQRPASRPATPQISSTSTKSPKPAAATATPTTDRSSEEKLQTRKSGDSTRAYHRSITPLSETQNTPPSPAPQPQISSSSGGGGGWWGGLFATATAAVKQAEAAVQEIRKNEEAQKWADQVRGNVGALRGLGGELRTLALPTVTSLLHTLAPPISTHERLQIHITHDLQGYPALDPLIYNVFSRVMAQVEGGDLLVIQRGQEAAPKRGEGAGTSQYSSAGWNDGPWWRYASPGGGRSISAIKGTMVASKLVRASAESYANDFFAARGGIEEATRQASEILSDTNPVRNSDIFLAIQAISQPVPEDLFQAGAGPSGETDKPASGVVEAEQEAEEEVSFAVYLHDPIHGIAFHTISQSLPQKWIDWLDAPAPDPSSTDQSSASQEMQSTVPEAIAEIIESGGVDPREWVAEWVEDAITLAVGVVAQRYVARRMGVGVGGINKGKMKAEQATVVDSGAGEAARAI